MNHKQKPEGTKFKSLAVMCLSALTFAVIFLSGCGGNAGSATGIANGSGNDIAEIRQAVENTPFLEALSRETLRAEETKRKPALPPGVSSVTRTAIAAKRFLNNITVVDSSATASATFTLEGALFFMDASNNTIAQKPMDMSLSGEYALTKDTAGNWKISGNPVDNLIFRLGNVVVGGVSMSPLFPKPGDTVTFKITLGSLATLTPEFFAVIAVPELNVRVNLVDDGTAGDASAGDFIYTAQVIFPNSVATGKYMAVLDIIEKTTSFDLTLLPTGNYLHPFNTIIATQGIVIDTFQELVISTTGSTSPKVGDIIPFKATAHFPGDSMDITKLVSWKSSNTTVGELDPAGFFYALSQGTTTVTALAESTTSSNSISITVSGI